MNDEAKFPVAVLSNGSWETVYVTQAHLDRLRRLSQPQQYIIGDDPTVHIFTVPEMTETLEETLAAFRAAQAQTVEQATKDTEAAIGEAIRMADEPSHEMTVDEIIEAVVGPVLK